MISYRTILFGTVAVLAAAAPATATSIPAQPAYKPVARTPYTSIPAQPAYKPVMHTPFTSIPAQPALVRVIEGGLVQIEEAILLR
ncbi:MAG TPA: hypothetical protein VKT72_16810 [Candidatus Baltobacteraceae bacterium]|nr:hypothetical protein [Candidatus Baltobacteraceae bacterium]